MSRHVEDTMGRGIKVWQAPPSAGGTTEANDLFALRLDYEAGNGKLKADPRHNGNISAVSWRSAGDGVVRGYGYTYDAIGRLREARYAAHSAGSTRWDAKAYPEPAEWVGRYDVPLISYGQNEERAELKRVMGRCLLTQHGWRPGTASFGMIDDLRYTYNGNQLQAVRDQSTQHGDKDFQNNGATSFQEEQAEWELVKNDAQGSLTADANLGITAVTYNHSRPERSRRIGLTETVTLTGGRQLRYLYAADGTRLARVRVQAGQADLRDDLVGAVSARAGFAYQGGVLNHILNTEGRIVPAVSPGRQYRHEYHYRDQLGNLRLAFSDLNNNGTAEVGDILQEAHYYPYGLGFSGMATVSNGVPSRYMFNGKEAQEAFGIGWIDFGARMYDAQLGRWMAVDGMAEKTTSYSPYHFVLGNPIGYLDPDGNSADWFSNGRGEIVWDNSRQSTLTRNGETYRNMGSTLELRAISYISNRSITTLVYQELLEINCIKRSLFLEITPQMETLQVSVQKLSRKEGRHSETLGYKDRKELLVRIISNAKSHFVILNQARPSLRSESTTQK